MVSEYKPRGHERQSRRGGVMDENTARNFGFLLACQARVFGMVAENEARKARGEGPAYDESSFFAEANTIDTIARQI